MIRISFIGDIGLNDGYIKLKNNELEPFDNLKQVFASDDLVVGNLECILEGTKGENLLKRPRLKTTYETLLYLKSINLGLASLATNHIYDNLEDGFINTVNFLSDNKISFLGAGLNRDIAKKPFILEKNNIKICFLNYITADTNPSLPPNAGVFLNDFSEEKCISDLLLFKYCHYRVVLLHWGGKFEGGLYPDFYQIKFARKLIDNGADLIIGHHSHTFQPFEKYKGKYIFYSLGNFCFSDINFDGKIRKMSSLRERESGIVNVTFSEEKYNIDIIPFINQDLILYVRNIIRIKLLIRNLIFKLIKLKPIWNIYKYWFFNFRPIIIQLHRKDENMSLSGRIIKYLLRKKK